MRFKESRFKADLLSFYILVDKVCLYNLYCKHREMKS